MPPIRAQTTRVAVLAGSNSWAARQPGGRFPTTGNAVVRACIGGKVKREAATVLAAMRLTVSDAFRMRRYGSPLNGARRSNRSCRTPK